MFSCVHQAFEFFSSRSQSRSSFLASKRLSLGWDLQGDPVCGTLTKAEFTLKRESKKKVRRENSLQNCGKFGSSMANYGI